MDNVKNNLFNIEKNIMSGLKDFQRATVDRIDSLYRSGQKRILVSDEVGLGKTLIARGTIAKLAILRKSENDRLFKVVYICSNAAIAAQNLNKLKISKELKTESTSSSRLSMQHLNIFLEEHDAELLNRYIQLIPLTPDTSFRMTIGAGIVEERALMFAILRRVKELSKYKHQLEVAMEDLAYSAWGNAKIAWEKNALECNRKTNRVYFSYMEEKISEQINKMRSDSTTLLQEIEDMCKKISKKKCKREDCISVIGKLRGIFAQISIDKLEPDLVIMDEFQRFKYLIESDEDTEIGKLAKRFFNGEDVRMLMLSATPYKMYSTLEEINDSQMDEHYSEFFKVMDFLITNPIEQNNFREVWSSYSVKLKELTSGDTTILEVKNSAENELYKRICRTERASAIECADFIDDKNKYVTCKYLEQDIKSFIQIQGLLNEMKSNISVPVDYMKSTPYILSFMRDYQLKKIIERYFKSNPDEINKANKDALWLKRREIDNYEEIKSNNARLETVKNHAFSQNAEMLLWVPPSLPYYELGGVFKDSKNFSKMLVFSSWEMVPRMIASMLSYESERKTVGKLAKATKGNEAHYFSTGEKRYPAPRLNFSVSLDTPKGMPLFCLLYPSQFLSSCYKPIESLNSGMSIKEIEKEIREKISEKIAKIPYSVELSGRSDERWYYLAPLLFDNNQYVKRWLDSGETLASYDDEDNGEKRQKGFLAHIAELKRLYETGSITLGKQPDDLLDTLTTIAIASPAVCIYRTYKHYSEQENDIAIDMASQISKVFINRMNTVESTAVIELCFGKSEEAHWRNLLDYCKDGSLQSVFDEYAHIIVESNGLNKLDNTIALLHQLIIESMNIRTVPYNVDTYLGFKGRIQEVKSKPVNIRTHFATAFTKGDGANKDADRKKTVRISFNSPFRPFVLASTSIGQEGLDFHYYCRKIVHWNLPSNPIDLEQREGRINRFKCLAIRQNVAKRYKHISFKKDIWNELFEEALLQEKNENCSELIPFWGLTESDDMIKIERLILMYPMSKDVSSYERLIKILSLYRLTLGQARQEELLEYFFSTYNSDYELKKLFINLSPYYKE